MSITKASLIDLNGQELILDADADTSITADTDDQIDIKIAGSDVIILTSSMTTINGDIAITDTSPAITFNDNSVTNLEHKINSSSDNLTIRADVNDVDSGNRVEIFVASQSSVRFNKGSTVFNEGGADVDFRVEGDSEANLFFVDASTDRVGIGTNTPTGPFHLRHSTPQFYIQSDDGNAASIVFGDASDASRGQIQYTSSDEMEFKVNNLSTALTISSTGRLTNTADIVPGADVIMSNGRGISFAATSDATGMSSELLDDYEEGTWTPLIDGSTSVSGQSYTTQTASYTKVGRKITANFQILLSNKGTISGVLRVSGLPFSGISTPLYQTATLQSGNVSLDADQQLTGMQYAANSFIYLMIQEPNQALSQPTTSILNNNTEISGSVSYFTS